MHLVHLRRAALATLMFAGTSPCSLGQESLWRQISPKDSGQPVAPSKGTDRAKSPAKPANPVGTGTTDKATSLEKARAPKIPADLFPVPDLIISNPSSTKAKDAKEEKAAPPEKSQTDKEKAVDPFAPNQPAGSSKLSTKDPFALWLGIPKNNQSVPSQPVVIPAPGIFNGPQPIDAPYTPGSVGQFVPGNPDQMSQSSPGQFFPGNAQQYQYPPGTNGQYPPGLDGQYSTPNNGQYFPGMDGQYAPGSTGQQYATRAPSQAQSISLPPVNAAEPIEQLGQSTSDPNALNLGADTPGNPVQRQQPLPGSIDNPYSANFNEHANGQYAAAGQSSPSNLQVFPPEPSLPIIAPTESTGSDPLQHPYEAQIIPNQADSPEIINTPPVDIRIPYGFQPWWQQYALQPLRPDSTNIPVEINSLICDTLRFSARIRAVSDNALISQTAITRSAADFDPYLFAESKYNKINVPTGSVLEAGAGIPRLLENNWFYNAGVRRKTQLGSKLEASQKIGTRNSNSTFFNPKDQGNARLSLSFTQPLMQGAGRPYNTSLIVLAKLDTDVALGQTSTELQDHLVEVTQSLWDLYLYRAGFLQKQRNAHRAQAILDRLVSRREFDSLDSQIARARSAVASRSTALIRADTVIRNLESELRSQINSPTLISDRTRELVPVQAPISDYIPVGPADAVITALENRPEIDISMKELEAARVRSNVAKNELMPVLDVVLESYLSGLKGNYDVAQSLVDQFSVGGPSYTAGFNFEMPLGRRAAGANNQRRLLEIRKLTSQYEATIQTLISETEIAVREVQTSFRELQSHYEALLAAESDLQYLERRWEMLPGDDRSATFLLADLLDAQDRLTEEEFAFTKAQVNYTFSLTGLNRATGMLLKQEKIELVSGVEEGLPVQRFEKQIFDNSVDAMRQ